MATIEIEKTLKEVNELVSHFIKMPKTKMWIDYDREADVLSLVFLRVLCSLCGKPKYICQESTKQLIPI
ncbi:MAG: hypothetical protein NUV74_00810 [Candidatus Brocadiaceae bacterium]|nr:hypothetical protein [Candidatus Brocadiaceae bacterium]